MNAKIFQHVHNQGFPSFLAAFEPDPQRDGYRIYQSALKLSEGSRQLWTVSIIRLCVAGSSNAVEEVRNLFADSNWRPQIIGAVTLLIVPSLVTEATLAGLWEAFDCGSWVSPQLAVVARFSESEFLPKAQRRIQARCPISLSRLGDLKWPERHSDAGPGSFANHSAKALAALIATCTILAEGESDSELTVLARPAKIPFGIRPIATASE